MALHARRRRFKAALPSVANINKAAAIGREPTKKRTSVPMGSLPANMRLKAK